VAAACLLFPNFRDSSRSPRCLRGTNRFLYRRRPCAASHAATTPRTAQGEGRPSRRPKARHRRPQRAVRGRVRTLTCSRGDPWARCASCRRRRDELGKAPQRRWCSPTRTGSGSRLAGLHSVLLGDHAFGSGLASPARRWCSDSLAGNPSARWMTCSHSSTSLTTVADISITTSSNRGSPGCGVPASERLAEAQSPSWRITRSKAAATLGPNHSRFLAKSPSAAPRSWSGPHSLGSACSARS